MVDEAVVLGLGDPCGGLEPRERKFVPRVDLASDGGEAVADRVDFEQIGRAGVGGGRRRAARKLLAADDEEHARASRAAQLGRRSGGDGTHRGAYKLSQECAKRGLNVAVAGIPKTIDNDIGLIDRSFGFLSAVEAAQAALESARVEASNNMPNGIAIVKLMGRSSG